MHEHREGPAQRARIEGSMGDTNGEGLAAGNASVFLELRRGEPRAHRGEGGHSPREGGRCEARARKIEPETHVRMHGAERRGHGVQHLAHVVVADHDDCAVGRDIACLARQLDGLRLVCRQRWINPVNAYPNACRRLLSLREIGHQRAHEHNCHEVRERRLCNIHHERCCTMRPSLPSGHGRDAA